MNLVQHIDHVDRDSLMNSAPHGTKVFHTGEWVFDASRTVARITAMTIFGWRLHVDLSARSEEPAVVDDEGRLRHVNLSLLAGSVSSGSRRRDRRLRGPAFLDADAFPTIGFVGSGNDDVVSGIMSAKGRPSPVSFVATNATLQPDSSLDFSCEGRIMLKSLGLGKLAHSVVGPEATFQACGVAYPA
ncbi:MAG: YceI family protein [Ornithinimicrobium sp.]